MKNIKAAELQKRINQGKEIRILDVRSTEDFEIWKIEDELNLHVINIPFNELEYSYDHLDAETEIFVFCNRGIDSLAAVELLEKDGFSAINVEGGMKAWSSQFNNYSLELENVNIVQFERISKGCLSYMVIHGKEAIVIDPAIHINIYLEYLKEHKLELTSIIDTHLHSDHVSGALDLKIATGAQYYCPLRDFESLEAKQVNVQDGFQIPVGDYQLRFVELPGHSHGSMILLLDETVVFSGDSLLLTGPGRPECFEHSKDLARHLFKALTDLPKIISDDALMLPAHHSSSETNYESGLFGARFSDIIDKSPLYSISTERSFIDMVVLRRPPQPLNFSYIRQLNLSASRPSIDYISELEFCPNFTA